MTGSACFHLSSCRLVDGCEVTNGSRPGEKNGVSDLGSDSGAGTPRSK